VAVRKPDLDDHKKLKGLHKVGGSKGSMGYWKKEDKKGRSPLSSVTRQGLTGKIKTESPLNGPSLQFKKEKRKTPLDTL